RDPCHPSAMHVHGLHLASHAPADRCPFPPNEVITSIDASRYSRHPPTFGTTSYFYGESVEPRSHEGPPMEQTLARTRFVRRLADTRPGGYDRYVEDLMRIERTLVDGHRGGAATMAYLNLSP